MSRKAILFICFVLLQSFPWPVTSDTVADVCSSLGSLCSASIEIPTGATVEYKQGCTNNCCEWSCGQTVIKSVPCFGCSRQHCGRTCVFGACINNCCFWSCDQSVDVPCVGCSKSQCGETCVNVPDTLRVRYTELTLCDAVKSATGLDAQTVIDACPCLGKIAGYLEDFSQDVAQITTTAVASGGDLANCLATNGFDVQDNAAETKSSDYGSDDVIIEGPVVDAGFYFGLAGAIAGCSVGATCDAITGMFLKLFKDTGSVVGEELVNVFESVYIDKLYNSVAGPITQVRDLAEALPRQIQGQLRSCTSGVPTAVESELKAALGDLQEFASDFEGILMDAQTFLETVQSSIDALSNVVDTLSKSYTQHLLDVVAGILQGEAPAYDDGIKFLLESDDVVNSLDAASRFTASLPGVGQQLMTISDVLMNIESLMDESECDVGVSGIDTLQSEVDSAISSIAGLGSIYVDDNTFQAGVISYNRWFDVSVDLPCSRSGTKDFSLEGLTITRVPYPEFYSCPYTTRVPMPNEHVPYLRIKNFQQYM